jgi:uncharacterized delta-60 repeat protein
VAVAAFSFLLTLVTAADFGLDTSFGNSGKVTTDFIGLDDDANALIRQPDGKLVVAGRTIGMETGSDFALARYNVNGTLDTTFGIAGKVRTHFSVGDSANALALQPDGKLVAAGAIRQQDGSGNHDFGVVRYMPDGTVDSTFGTGGKVTTDFSGENEFVTAILIQADAKIIVAGGNLARYNTDGTLDPTFGNAGKLITNFSALAIVQQPDGKLVTCGTVPKPSGVNGFGVARYNLDGTPDPSFGSNGKVLTYFSNRLGFETHAFAQPLVLQPDGKLVVAGVINEFGTGNDVVLVRYTANGSLDGSFGNDGKVTTDFDAGSDYVNALVIQPDGKFVAAGGATTGSQPDDFSLIRYNVDGSLDLTFGNGGRITTDFFGGTEWINAIVLQPDGKLAATGPLIQSGTRDFDFALARYAVSSTSLGDYSDVSTPLSSNILVTPNAIPATTTSTLVSTSTSFKGVLTADPTTGVVKVTDAHPAGTYVVTVRAFGPTAIATKTFQLTVTTPPTCGPMSFTSSLYGVGANPQSIAVGDFNGDRRQDLAITNSDSDNVSVL